MSEHAPSSPASASAAPRDAAARRERAPTAAAPPWAQRALAALAARTRSDETGAAARPASAAGEAITIAELAETVRAQKRRRLKPGPCREWERILDTTVLPRLGALPIGELAVADVAAFIGELEDRGLRAASIRSYLKPLAAISRHALRRGLIERNPFELLNADERPRATPARRPTEWTPETIGRLLRAAHERDRRAEARYRYHPVLATLALTGARVGEVLALRPENLDLEARLIRIRHTWTREGTLTQPKTAAAVRDIPIGDQLAAILTPLPARRQAQQWLFPSRTGAQPVSYWNLAQRGLAPAVRAAGLGANGIRIHDLRHAAASLLIAAGLTPVEVAAQLGHTNPAVTLKVYAHLFDRDRSHRRARAAFDAIPLG